MKITNGKLDLIMKTVAAHQFNVEETNPYFTYYLMIHDFKVGDEYKLFDFVEWVQNMHNKFIAHTGKEFDPQGNGRVLNRNPRYIHHFTNWLEKLAKKDAT